VTPPPWRPDDRERAVAGRSRQAAALACRDLVVAPGGRIVLRRLSLEIPAGARTVVVGPSGAGKTTLLRAIAGLERLLEGEIRLGGRRLDMVPAHRRRIAVVFQEPRLLPHLDVADNVAFGLRAVGVARAQRRARALWLLDEVGLTGFGGRGVEGLSGGEQQRVALARALCVEPDLLLLDEPLAGVDPNGRDGLRRLLVGLQQARALTTLLITHDRAEAALLGERVALLLDGTIVQHGTPQALFERPASATVARFFGTRNLLRGRATGGRLVLGAASIQVPGPDGEATVAIRPECIRLDDHGPLRLTVATASYVGTHVRLELRGQGLTLQADVPATRAPRVGEVVGVALPLQDLWRLPDSSGAQPPRSEDQPANRVVEPRVHP
jgi:ABC-type Fe3+/spermidine/putrescine transport system ATPase subunit